MATQARVGLALLALLVLGGCQTSTTRTPTAPLVTSSSSGLTAAVSPSARASEGALASPTAPGAPERVPLRLAVTLDPPRPEVGQTFTLSLAVTNQGARATEGVFIATSGPWDLYTVLAVQPSGMFGRDAAGWHFVSPLHIAPGETQALRVEARADQPTEEQLTFAVREAEPGEAP